MAREKISWAAWSLSDVNQLSGMLKNNPSPDGNWGGDQLAESGWYIRDKIREGK
jgi:hypothetical protein